MSRAALSPPGHSFQTRALSTALVTVTGRVPITNHIGAGHGIRIRVKGFQDTA